MDSQRLRGLALAAGSGLLYGSINVLAKPIDAHPVAKSASMYLVAALVLSPWALRLRVVQADWPKVLTMGLVGAGVAPLLLFFGLRETAAADAGLLLTLEMVTTAVLAMVVLRERFRLPEGVGLLLLLAAAAAVALAGGDGDGATSRRGAALVLLSAVAWGIDNTVSTRLVGSYLPIGLVAVKGAIGGVATLAVALALRPQVPGLPELGALAGLGVLAIGVSSLCFYTALQAVGAARTSAMNIAGTALVGAAGGALLLHERLHPFHGIALGLALGGAWLLAHHQAAGDGRQPPAKP